MGLQDEILAISRRSENSACVDCRMPQPTWASFNLGVFMCMTCSGHHRSLGTHITRVRSVTMDNWDAPSVSLMGSIGNIRANSYWEATLPPHMRLHPGVDDRVRAEFIRSKYVNRTWYGVPNGANGGTPFSNNGSSEPPKQLSKMEQRQARLQAKAAAAAAAGAAPAPTPSGSPSIGATPTNTPSSSVPQPSSNLRQSSMPIPSSSTNVGITGTSAALFAGMSFPSTTSSSSASATVPTTTTPLTTSSPSPPPTKLPAKVHSASPWVTREEHQAVQQQYHHAHTRSHPIPPTVVPSVAASSSTPAVVVSNTSSSLNLLDFDSNDLNVSQPSTGGVVAHAVDDMFAGLSVSTSIPNVTQTNTNTMTNNNTSSSNGVNGTNISSNELLSFYASEPSSAPARSQHTQQSQPTTVTTPSVQPPSYQQPPSSSSNDMFSFIQESSSPSTSPNNNQSNDLYASININNNNNFSNSSSNSNSLISNNPINVGSVSSFSFLSDDSTTNNNSLPSSLASNVSPPLAESSSAFSFLGGGVSDVSVDPLSSSNLLLPVGSPDPSLPPLPDMSSLIGPPGQPINGTFLQPIAAPITHSYSQPLHGATNPYGGMNGMMPNGVGGVIGGVPPAGVGYGLAPPSHSFTPSPYGGVGGGIGLPTMGGIDSLGSLTGAPPAQLQFQVQSIQHTHAQAQARQQELANDPFAHIQVQAISLPSSSSSTLTPLGGIGGVGAPLNQAPKQPHQCDVDGCDGKKVSRGLCSKHIAQAGGGGGGVSNGNVSVGTSSPPINGVVGQNKNTFEFLTDANATQFGKPTTTNTTAPMTTPASSFDFI